MNRRKFLAGLLSSTTLIAVGDKAPIYTREMFMTDEHAWPLMTTPVVEQETFTGMSMMMRYGPTFGQSWAARLADDQRKINALYRQLIDDAFHEPVIAALKAWNGGST